MVLVVLLSVSASAQRQFDELRKRTMPISSTGLASPQVLTDLDGDGDLDIAFLGQDTRVYWYANDGRGRYTDVTSAHPPVQAGYFDKIAFGDVDGDGDPDLVAAGRPFLWLNDGTGSFTDVSATHMPWRTGVGETPVLGDMDGDGDLDVVFGSFGRQNALYLNDGQGHFTDVTQTRLPPDTDYTHAVAVGDVDQDGDLDLVFGNSSGTSLSGQQNRLYVNDGTGTFRDETSVRLPVDADHTNALALGDVDGDGDLDLVCGNGHSQQREQSRLYLNDGAGSFVDGTAGRLPSALLASADLTFGDVDGDSDLDMVLAARIYVNDGFGSFSDGASAGLQVPPLGGWVSFGDVDRDGDLDITCGAQPQILLLLNDGGGSFADATPPRVPDYALNGNSIATADVDGDGDLDLLVGTYGQNRLLQNRGDGNLTDVTAGRMPPDSAYTESLAVGDVDGDGDLDVVCGNGGYFWQQSCLYVNDGVGRFTDVTSSHMPIRRERTRAVTLADVDGDGDLDLILANAAGHTWEQNLVYRNDGSGVFADASAGRVPNDNDDSGAVAAGDVDGDGDVDLVFGNLGQQNRLYRNDGPAGFTDVTAAQMPPDADLTKCVALADVDADGDVDLILANGGYGAASSGLRQQDRLYANDGAGRFTDVTATRLPTRLDISMSMVLGDIDEDGDVDILVSGFSPPTRLLLNDGTGTFTDRTATGMPQDSTESLASALGDLDGDGDLDLALGNYHAHSQIHRNLLRHVDTPFLLRAGDTFTLDVYSRHGAPSTVDVAWVHLATGTGSISLHPFGTYGLDPSRAVALPPVLIPQPAGVTSIDLAVPNAPSLAGLRVHAQALVVPYPLRAGLTNVTTDVAIR